LSIGASASSFESFFFKRVSGKLPKPLADRLCRYLFRERRLSALLTVKRGVKIGFCCLVFVNADFTEDEPLIKGAFFVLYPLYLCFTNGLRRATFVMSLPLARIARARSRT
jgi:hypothetical protein